MADVARDPSGNLIDLFRPALSNEDGSFSTEMTTTVEFTDDSGQPVFVNMPTIVNGQRLTPDEAVEAFKRGENKPVGEFRTLDEATAAARARSETIGTIRPEGQDMNGLADLFAPPLQRPAPVSGPAQVQFGAPAAPTPGVATPALAGDSGGTMGGLASMYLGQQQQMMAAKKAALDGAMQARASGMVGLPTF